MLAVLAVLGLLNTFKLPPSAIREACEQAEQSSEKEAQKGIQLALEHYRSWLVKFLPHAEE